MQYAQLSKGNDHSASIDSYSVGDRQMQIKTYSEIRDTLLCRGVTKNLTPCRINIKIFKKYHVKAYDQSFPIMYNTI